MKYKEYRIIEKEGTQMPHLQPNSHVCGGNCGRYIPRYIVQLGEFISDLSDGRIVFQDLKEFYNLDEAKEYKRKQQLIDGIVVG